MTKAPKAYRLSRDSADPKRRPTQLPASEHTRDLVRELARRSRATQALVLERLVGDYGAKYLEKYGEQLELFFEPIDERLRHAQEAPDALDTAD